jgi:hypothetical protein
VKCGDANSDGDVNISDAAQYYGQHWEARIMATSVDNLTSSGFLVYGVETKFLLDTPTLVVESGQTDIFMFAVVGSGIGGAIAVCFFIFVISRRYRLPKKTKIAAEKKPIPTAVNHPRKIVTDETALEKAHQLLDDLNK